MRARNVTGVQTCALPISPPRFGARRPRVGGRARRAPNRGGADAGRRYLPARAPVDAVLDLWVRGRRARRPRERGGVRTVPLPGGGADRAAVLSGRRPQPQRAGRRPGAVGRALGGATKARSGRLADESPTMIA